MRFITLLSMAMSLAAGLPASALERQLWTSRYQFQAGGRLTVENVQGDIRVEGWDRPEVEVAAIKTAVGPGARLDDVQIAIELGNHALNVRTVYFGESEEPVRVDYRLRVPRQVRLDRLSTVEGDIAARDIEGSVDARSLNGNIQGINVTGRMVARAINGNIAVSLRALPVGTAPLYLDTLNGNVDLQLPPKPNADLELSTVAGRIEGQYVFVASTVPGDSMRRAHLGRGGVLVRLRTVRGNVRVAERDDLL